MSEIISVATPFERQIRAKELEMAKEAEEKLERERKKSPYSKWTQVNSDDYAYNAEDWLIANSPNAYRILKFLVTNMDRQNAILCSYKVFQEKFGYSKATIERAIKVLKDKQYVKVVKSGTSNIYLINKTLYWNSWGSNYAYAEFGAKIIISASEQEKEFQEEIQLEIKKRQEVVIKGEQKAS